MTELELQEAFMNDFKELLCKYGAEFEVGYEVSTTYEVIPYAKLYIPPLYDYEKDKLVRPYTCVELPTYINPNT
jgi:hypothetical protein